MAADDDPRQAARQFHIRQTGISRFNTINRGKDPPTCPKKCLRGLNSRLFTSDFRPLAEIGVNHSPSVQRQGSAVSPFIQLERSIHRLISCGRLRTGRIRQVAVYS